MGETQGFHMHSALQGKDMAYRKVLEGHRGPLHSQDPENEELQSAAQELEWDMEKELEDPCADRLQLDVSGCRPVGRSTGHNDLDMEPIQPSVSLHGRFERLQEDPDYVSHFTRPAPNSRTRGGCLLARYLLLGSGLFMLGLVIGRYAHSSDNHTSGTPADTSLYQKVMLDITAQKIRDRVRALTSVSTEGGELSTAIYLLQQWTTLGLTDVYLANYSVLVSLPGSSPNTIKDKASSQCFLPNGQTCNTWSLKQKSVNLFSFAAYSAVGTLEAEVVDVQFGSIEDLIQANTTTNVTNKIALLKLGHAPLLYKISLLAEVGFGGVLTYIDPCDLSGQQREFDKAFGVTLNPGGDPSTPMYPSLAGIYREERPNLTSLLVQPISASLAKELLSAVTTEDGSHCTPLAKPPASARKTITLTIDTRAAYKTVYNVIGYLKGTINPDRYVLVGSHHDSWHSGTVADWSSGTAVMTEIIASLTRQARSSWQPDRTTVFCSWGGSAMGNIGSFEWGEENQVLLQSNAVAYISLHNPVKGRGVLESVASPALFQVVTDIHKKLLLNCTRGGNCTGPNVSSVQTPGDVNFFANHLAIPTAEFAFQETKAEEKTSFLSEALFAVDSSVLEALDPAFNLHEMVAKVTGETILRLASDPVLPFYPLDIALDCQNKLKDDKSSTNELLAKAASLRESSMFFQSEMMRPANDPKEQSPPHVRMLNDVLRDLERNFVVSQPPPGFYRNILYCLNANTAQFSILKDAQDMKRHNKMNLSLSLVLNAINSAEGLIRSGLDLFENNPGRTD